jgi:hypothetical protein
VDIYNPYEEPLRAEFGYSTVVQSAIVQPGKNTLWLHIDRIKLDFVKQGENESFFVHVDNPEGKMPDYYVDNLCAYTTEIPFQPYERDMANNIKLSFENNAETSFITHDSRAAAEKRVVCTINRDARYVKSGNGSLKAEYQAGGYGTFSISSDAIGDLNEYLLDPYDMIIPVYNPNDFAVGLTIQVYGDYQSENMFLTQQIAPDSWCDFSFSVEQMSAYFTGDGLTIGKGAVVGAGKMVEENVKEGEQI